MVIKAGGFALGCVGCCLPVGSAMSRKVLFVRWPPDFSISYKHGSVGNIGVNRILFLRFSLPSPSSLVKLPFDALISSSPNHVIRETTPKGKVIRECTEI